MFSRVPPLIEPMLKTAGSLVISSERLMTVCSALTICAEVTMGSTPSQGAAPWVCLPSTVMRTVSALARTGPLRQPITPLGMTGAT
ncbi:hypothetical protein D3C72_2043050 [compost metagenome]